MTLTLDRSATSVIVDLRIKADAGTAIAGLLHNTAGLSIDYRRPADTAWQSVPLVAGTVGAWISGGFVESPGADGWYQFGLPNVAIVADRTTQLRVKTAGNAYRYGAISATASGSASAPRSIIAEVDHLPAYAPGTTITTQFSITGGTFSGGPYTLRVYRNNNVASVATGTIGTVSADGTRLPVQYVIGSIFVAGDSGTLELFDAAYSATAPIGVKTFSVRLPVDVTGSGEHSVTFAVTNAATSAAVPVCRVSIFTAGGVLVASRTTGSDGTFRHNLNAGSYTLNATAANHNIVSGLAFIVSTNGQTVPVAMTGAVITAPTAPGLCTVRCYAVDGSGVIVAGARVHAYLEAVNATVPNTLVSRAILEGTTNASGFADLTLIQYAAFTSGGLYMVEMHVSGRRMHSRRIAVPSNPTAYLADIPTA